MQQERKQTWFFGSAAIVVLSLVGAAVMGLLCYFGWDAVIGILERRFPS